MSCNSKREENITYFFHLCQLINFSHKIILILKPIFCVCSAFLIQPNSSCLQHLLFNINLSITRHHIKDYQFSFINFENFSCIILCANQQKTAANSLMPLRHCPVLLMWENLGLNPPSQLLISAHTKKG